MTNFCAKFHAFNPKGNKVRLSCWTMRTRERKRICSIRSWSSLCEWMSSALPQMTKRADSRPSHGYESAAGFRTGWLALARPVRRGTYRGGECVYMLRSVSITLSSGDVTRRLMLMDVDQIANVVLQRRTSSCMVVIVQRSYIYHDAVYAQFRPFVASRAPVYRKS